MIFTSVYLCLVLSITLTLNEQGMADSDAPTVMEAVIHALNDFRREMLDNLNLSLEFHTDQLEEIKHHVEHEIEEQEKRMTNRVVQLQDNIETIQSRIVDLQEEAKQMKVIKNRVEQVIEENKSEENRMKKENHQFRSILGELVPVSCNQVKSNITGAYYINPYEYIEKPILVLCNFENNFNRSAGWTVFQRRMDRSTDFYQNWTMYKHGFGDVYGEHWLGLENLHVMTKSGRHELLVLLEDFEGNSTYALYDEFKIGSEEDKYKLTVGKYLGAAGDRLKHHNGMKFSTKDQDNDLYDDVQESCAEHFKGAWWFGNCYNSHLNGQYNRKGNHLGKHGVQWQWPRTYYSLKSTTMMFRSRT